MPIPSQYQKILQDLLDLTQQGKIQWSQGALRSTYLTSLKDYSISLGEPPIILTPGGQYSFSLLNSQGAEIDSFNVYGLDEGFSQVKDLWERAQRQASRVDEAIAELARELEALGQSAGPAVAVSSLSLHPGQTGTVDVIATGMSPPGLGAWTIDVSYDPSKVSAVDCSATQGGVCNPAFAPDRVRLTGASAVGLVGDVTLATIEFAYVQEGVHPLVLHVHVLADATLGNPRAITAALSHGTLTCHPQ